MLSVTASRIPPMSSSTITSQLKIISNCSRAITMPGITHVHESFDEEASFQYLDWQDLYNIEKPFQVFSAEVPDDPDTRTTNLVFKNGPLEHIHDARGRESEFTVKDHGFAFRESTTALREPSLESVEQEYLPQMEKLIKSELQNVDRIFFFDWRVSFLSSV
jgi:hypothetical protein